MRVRSPSDMARALGPAEARPSARKTDARMRIGGRLRRAEGGPGWQLVDGFAGVDLPGWVAPDVVRENDLAVLDGLAVALTDARLRLEGARLVKHHPVARARNEAPTDSAPSDVDRFVGGGVARALRARSGATRRIRAHFEGEGFIEVETPALVPCPGLDLHLDAFAVVGIEPPRLLGTSPEYQMKRLLVGGIPRSFQIGRAFRAGELGRHHNPEFTMIEWYRAFEPWSTIVQDTEAIVVETFAAVRELDGSVTTELDLSRPFARLSVADAFERFARVRPTEMLRLANEDEERFFRLLIEEVEPRMAEMNAPVVLHHYPASMASLARLDPEDSRFAERFEVYANGVELSNGFGELTDPVEQRARFVKDRELRAATQKQMHPIDERFLGALEEGMPPSSGNALGFDRLMMLALGKDSIADVVAFPHHEL